MPYIRPRHRAATGRSSDRSARAANLALMRMMHSYRNYVAPEHGTKPAFPRGQAASHVPPRGSGSALAGVFLLAFPLLQAPRVGRPTRGVEELDTATS